MIRYKPTGLVVLALSGLLSFKAFAEAPFIDYDWEVSNESTELCVYSADLLLRELGFNVTVHSGEVVARRGNYKAVVACLPGRTVYVVAGPSYRQASRYTQQIKQGFNPPLSGN